MSVGQHVILDTADGKTFSGILNAIDDRAGKVVLKNVVADGCRLPDLQTFFASDIKDLAFTEGCGTRGNGSDSLLDHVKRVPGKFMSRKNVPVHLQQVPVFNGDRMLLSHIAGEDDGTDQGIGSGEDGDNFEDFYETDDYLLVCRPCEKFREAIVYLMDQEYVATVFHGVDMGRKGALSLLQIATEEYIFLFDILRLGLEGFIEGLQELLESKDVVKIVHDCRMVSDILYHQYNVALSNVFDTQVAGAFVYRDCNEGDWPRYVESLPRALVHHLNLSEDEVHIAFVRERSKKMDQEVWLQRPLSRQLLTSTLKNVRKLIPLYHFMWQKLMLPFKVGVQVYLDQVRDAPEGVVAKQKISGHLLPHAFQDLEIRTSSLSREFTYSRMRTTMYDHKGFKENIICPGRQRSKVISSRDSIWHSVKPVFPTSRPQNTQSKATAGLPPEEKGSKNRSPRKVNSPMKNSKSKDVESSSSRLSNLGSHDSPVANEAKQTSRDSSDALLEESPSGSIVLKSSTPNNSGTAPSPSTEIYQSALFRLDDFLSHLSRSKSLISDDHVGQDDKNNASQSLMASHVLDQSMSGRQGNRMDVFKDNESNKLGKDDSFQRSEEFFSLTSGIEENSPKASEQACSSEASQSENESHFAQHHKRAPDVAMERSYDNMNLLPAGFQTDKAKIGKKRTKRIQQQIQHDRVKGTQASSKSPTMVYDPYLEEDLGSIPMHRSLHNSKAEKQSRLNMAEHGIQDPCALGASMSVPTTSKSVLSQLKLPRCQSVIVPLSSTEDDEESLVDEILRLEEVQKILRQTKQERPTSDIRNKLLSSKIKL